MRENHKLTRTNIRISRMPHDLRNEYPNIFGCHILTKRITEYIRTQEMTQIPIQIIFKGHFIWIFVLITDYSTFEKRLNDAVFYVNFYTWCLFDARIRLIFSLFSKHRQENFIIRFKANIRKYSYFYEFTNKYPNILGQPKFMNKYPNIFKLGKWHKYQYD